MRPKVKSAHDSCSTPGVLPIRMPLRVAAGMSMLSKPTARLATTLSVVALSSSSASMMSVTSVSKAPHSCAFSSRRERGGGAFCCHTSMSYMPSRYAIASGMIWLRVMNILSSGMNHLMFSQSVNA